MRNQRRKVTIFTVFNPFRDFFNEADVLRSTRLLAFIALYLGAMDFARALGLWRLGINVFSPGHEAFRIEWAVTFVVGVMLSWLMYVRQPLWVGFIVAIWEVADLASKTAGIATGHRHFSLSFLISFILLGWVLVLATRANWKLHMLRKHELTSSS